MNTRVYLNTSLLYSSSFFMLTSLLSGCAPASKSPIFAKGTQVTIQGLLLNADQKPLEGANIYFQNPNYFGYVDAIQLNLIEFILLPFELLNFGRSDNLIKRIKSTWEKDAALFSDSMKTDSAGRFNFSIDESKLNRDKDGGINIEIGYRDIQKSSLQYHFVIKDAATKFEQVSLCDPGKLTFEESADNVTLKWVSPPQKVQVFMVRISNESGDGLVWVEKVAGDLTALTLPKEVFGDRKNMVSFDAFFNDEAEKKIFCTTPPQEFSLSQKIPSLAAGSITTSPQIKFKFTTLGNTKFNDVIFLDAFRPNQLTIDLGSKKTFSKILFHNLKLISEGSVIISSANSEQDSFTPIELAPETTKEKRYLFINFQKNISAQRLRFEFSGPLVDLQEVTLY